MCLSLMLHMKSWKSCPRKSKACQRATCYFEKIPAENSLITLVLTFFSFCETQESPIFLAVVKNLSQAAHCLYGYIMPIMVTVNKACLSSLRCLLMCPGYCRRFPYLFTLGFGPQSNIFLVDRIPKWKSEKIGPKCPGHIKRQRREGKEVYFGNYWIFLPLP